MLSRRQDVPHVRWPAGAPSLAFWCTTRYLCHFLVGGIVSDRVPVDCVLTGTPAGPAADAAARAGGGDQRVRGRHHWAGGGGAGEGGGRETAPGGGGIVRLGEGEQVRGKGGTGGRVGGPGGGGCSSDCLRLRVQLRGQGEEAMGPFRWLRRRHTPAVCKDCGTLMPSCVTLSCSSPCLTAWHTWPPTRALLLPACVPPPLRTVWAYCCSCLLAFPTALHA